MQVSIWWVFATLCLGVAIGLLAGRALHRARHKQAGRHHITGSRGEDFLETRPSTHPGSGAFDTGSAPAPLLNLKTGSERSRSKGSRGRRKP